MPPSAYRAPRDPDAELQIARALDFYRSVDASFYVTELESALGDAQREST